MVEIALVIDTLSARAAITALFVGIEHLRYLKEHDLQRRAVLLIGLSIIVTVAIIVWHFGFRARCYTLLGFVSARTFDPARMFKLTC